MNKEKKDKPFVMIECPSCGHYGGAQLHVPTNRFNCYYCSYPRMSWDCYDEALEVKKYVVEKENKLWKLMN